MIHFEEPRFQFLIQNDVEAQQLIATVGLLLLAGAVDVLKLRLGAHDRLHHDRLNIVPDGVGGPHRRLLARLGGRLAHGAGEHFR